MTFFLHLAQFLFHYATSAVAFDHQLHAISFVTSIVSRSILSMVHVRRSLKVLRFRYKEWLEVLFSNNKVLEALDALESVATQCGNLSTWDGLHWKALIYGTFCLRYMISCLSLMKDTCLGAQDWTPDITELQKAFKEAVNTEWRMLMLEGFVLVIASPILQ